MSFVEKALTLARAVSHTKTGSGSITTPEAPPVASSTAAAVRGRHAAGSALLLPARVAAAGYALIGPSDPILTAQFRNIRHRLLEILAAQQASPVCLISISSAVPGEGKSFTSLNLSLSLAAHHRTNVTLVDFDQARCRMTHLFDCENRPGLVDALAAPASFQDFRYETGVANLSFMPIGTSPRGDLEIFSSEAVDAMAAAMRELREPRERHFFVFDCPPMLANEDAKYISQRSDLAVIVVKADSTPRHWTADTLEKAGPRARVALILNNRVSSIAEQHYGYGETLKDYLGNS